MIKFEIISLHSPSPTRVVGIMDGPCQAFTFSRSQTGKLAPYLNLKISQQGEYLPQETVWWNRVTQSQPWSLLLIHRRMTGALCPSLEEGKGPASWCFTNSEGLAGGAAGRTLPTGPYLVVKGNGVDSENFCNGYPHTSLLEEGGRI